VNVQLRKLIVRLLANTSGLKTMEKEIEAVLTMQLSKSFKLL
jgi:hypothetical protein